MTEPIPCIGLAPWLVGRRPSGGGMPTGPGNADGTAVGWRRDRGYRRSSQPGYEKSPALDLADDRAGLCEEEFPLFILPVAVKVFRESGQGQQSIPCFLEPISGDSLR